MALPIHLFRHFCCRMYRFSHNAQRHRQTDSQTDRHVNSRSYGALVLTLWTCYGAL